MKEIWCRLKFEKNFNVFTWNVLHTVILLFVSSEGNLGQCEQLVVLKITVNSLKQNTFENTGNAPKKALGILILQSVYWIIICSAIQISI